MICKNCGFEIKENQRFCTGCGMEIQKRETVMSEKTVLAEQPQLNLKEQEANEQYRLVISENSAVNQRRQLNMNLVKPNKKNKVWNSVVMALPYILSSLFVLFIGHYNDFFLLTELICIILTTIVYLSFRKKYVLSRYYLITVNMVSLGIFKGIAFLSRFLDSYVIFGIDSGVIILISLPIISIALIFIINNYLKKSLNKEKADVL